MEVYGKNTLVQRKREPDLRCMCVGGKGGGRLAQVNKGWPENYHGDEIDMIRQTHGMSKYRTKCEKMWLGAWWYIIYEEIWKQNVPQSQELLFRTECFNAEVDTG